MDHEVIRRLRAAMKAAGFDALVALSQDNVTYTAGFLVPSHALNRFRRTITVLGGDTFSAQMLSVTVEENLARARSRISDIRVYDQFSQDPADVLADALLEAGAGAGRIGIELDYMPAQDYIRLRERLPGAEFVHCRDLYFTARMIKTDEEIELLTKVGELTERVVGHALAEIRPGMTEKAVAQVVADRMMNGGCDGLRCQVGSGIRSGITNCQPTDKAIEKGRRDPPRSSWRTQSLSVECHANGRCRRADRRAAQNMGCHDRRPRALQEHAQAGDGGGRPLSRLCRSFTGAQY